MRLHAGQAVMVVRNLGFQARTLLVNAKEEQRMNMAARNFSSRHIIHARQLCIMEQGTAVRSIRVARIRIAKVSSVSAMRDT